MLPREERLLGNDNNDVFIIANDPRCWNSRTQTPAGAAVGLGKCRWGQRRGQRPSRGRCHDAYPVANRSVRFYLYLYLYRYLYPAAVYVRGGVILLPILLFLSRGLFGRSSVDFNREERTRMTKRGPTPSPPPLPRPCPLVCLQVHSSSKHCSTFLPLYFCSHR